ncbi:MAG: hypothetical protein ABI091_11135 [Ferruginibacter sp.]
MFAIKNGDSFTKLIQLKMFFGIYDVQLLVAGRSNSNRIITEVKKSMEALVEK